MEIARQLLQYGIRGVVFDAYGTLIKPIPRSQAYTDVITSAQSRREARRLALTANVSINELAARLDAPQPSEPSLDELCSQIASTTPYEDSIPTIKSLKAEGLKVVICSNLAEAYGLKTMELLKDADAFVFSYEIGFLKPDVEIYNIVCEQADLGPQELFFLGDTPAADVTGPQAFGMHAALILRSHGDILETVMSAYFHDHMRSPTYSS